MRFRGSETLTLPCDVFSQSYSAFLAICSPLHCCFQLYTRIYPLCEVKDGKQTGFNPDFQPSQLLPCPSLFWGLNPKLNYLKVLFH